jgi:hypothetical protein
MEQTFRSLALRPVSTRSLPPSQVKYGHLAHDLFVIELTQSPAVLSSVLNLVHKRRQSRPIQREKTGPFHSACLRGCTDNR